jgi:hypothetical protein
MTRRRHAQCPNYADFGAQRTRAQWAPGVPTRSVRNEQSSRYNALRCNADWTLCVPMRFQEEKTV